MFSDEEARPHSILHTAQSRESSSPDPVLNIVINCIKKKKKYLYFCCAGFRLLVTELEGGGGEGSGSSRSWPIPSFRSAFQKRDEGWTIGKKVNFDSISCRRVTLSLTRIYKLSLCHCHGSPKTLSLVPKRNICCVPSTYCNLSAFRGPE